MPPKKKAQFTRSPGQAVVEQHSTATASTISALGGTDSDMLRTPCKPDDLEHHPVRPSKVEDRTTCSFQAGKDDFVTVIVTPKLTFQLSRRPEWQTVDDISQDDLRRGFLNRFPPALWMSADKFSFRPTLPPTSKITQDTQALVFKLVSEEVSDERIMLYILRELEKNYEEILHRTLSERQSGSSHEQLLFQEQAEETRQEHEKQLKELRKENKGLRDQLQSIQKRLFFS